MYYINYSKVISIEDEPEAYEQLGTKAKAWYGDNRYLFKQGRRNTGEDWAEVLASAICDEIGIPHATYCFAEDSHGETGVITESIVPEHGRLILANEFLTKIFKEYNPQARYKFKEYRLGRVLALFRNLDTLKVPRTFTGMTDVSSPLDVFIGYLMLDALIGNQDRHHENLGFIISPEGFYLAETFDHASSLGRNESDERRKRILLKQDRLTVESYCAKAITPFYQSDKDECFKTVVAFQTAGRYSRSAAKRWQEQLHGISAERISSIFSAFPKAKNGPTETAQSFATAMILENKKRLLSLRFENE